VNSAESESCNPRFEATVAKFYLANGIIKGLIFSGIGVAFGAPKTGLTKILIIIVFVIALTVALEFIWFYRPEIKLHRRLKEDFKNKYLNLLSSAIEDIGYMAMVQRHWIVRCDENLRQNNTKDRQGT